jgi:hypothetical protein
VSEQAPGVEREYLTPGGAATDSPDEGNEQGGRASTSTPQTGTFSLDAGKVPVVPSNETSSMTTTGRTPVLRLGDRVRFRRGIYATTNAHVIALDVPDGAGSKGLTVKFGKVEMFAHYHEDPSCRVT